MTINDNKTNIVSDNEFLEALNASTGEPKIIEEKQSDKTPDEEFIESLSQEDTPPQPIEETIETPKDEVVEEAEEKVLTKFSVKDSILALMESGMWEDCAVKFDDKEYSNIQEFLDANKKAPNKEIFDMLSLAQKNLRDEKIKEEYLNIKGADSTKVKLVNAILSGVEYEDLLEYNKNIVEPVQKFDFADHQNGLKNAEILVRQCLLDMEGTPAKYIDAEIAELKRDFRLIEKAEEYQLAIQEAFEAELEIRQQTEQALRQETQKKEKELQKELKNSLKAKDFSDSFVQKAIQLRFSQDTDGKTHYEKLIAEKIKNDKDFESDFLHFLLDKDDFIKKTKAPVKTETLKKVLELTKVAPKDKGSSSPTSSPQNLTTADEDFLDALEGQK